VCASNAPTATGCRPKTSLRAHSALSVRGVGHGVRLGAQARPHARQRDPGWKETPRRVSATFDGTSPCGRRRRCRAGSGRDARCLSTRRAASRRARPSSRGLEDFGRVRAQCRIFAPEPFARSTSAHLASIAGAGLGAWVISPARRAGWSSRARPSPPLVLERFMKRERRPSASTGSASSVVSTPGRRPARG